MRVPTPWFDRERGALAFRLWNEVPVYVQGSFLIPAVILTFPFWFDASLAGFALAILLVVMIFASILLHEIAHMLMARRLQTYATDITIFAMGGFVNLVFPERGAASLWRIALAGPLANLVLAVFFFGLHALVAGSSEIADPRFVTPLPAQPSLLAAFTQYSAWFNLLIGAVNLLPALPLDGGMIAGAWLERRIGYRRAALVVGLSGLLLATLSGFVFLVSLLAGFPILAPLFFAPNWEAVRQNWRERKDTPSAMDNVVRLPPRDVPDWLKKRWSDDGHSKTRNDLKDPHP